MSWTTEPLQNWTCGSVSPGLLHNGARVAWGSDEEPLKELAALLNSAEAVAAERDEAVELLKRCEYALCVLPVNREFIFEIRDFLSNSAPAQPEKRARAIALIDDWLARDPIVGEDADLERLKLALNASADNRKPFPAQPEKPPTVEMRPSLADTYRPLYTMPTPTVEERDRARATEAEKLLKECQLGLDFPLGGERYGRLRADIYAFLTQDESIQAGYSPPEKTLLSLYQEHLSEIRKSAEELGKLLAKDVEIPR